MLPKDKNPYQSRLSEALAGHGVTAQVGLRPTGSATLNLLVLPLSLLHQRLRGVRILHLHWLFTMVPGSSAHSLRRRRWWRAWFGCQLWWARLLGLRVVWTAHNFLPHTPIFDDDVAARRTLIAHCDAVIAHSEDALAKLHEFGVPLPGCAEVIRHGPMLALPVPSRREARQRLGLPPEARIVGLVGRLEAYKGVDELVDTMRQLASDGRLPTGTVLVLAGACRDRGLRRRLRSLGAEAPWLHLALGYSDDETFLAYLAALDLAVLPFRAITTSGSAIAALEAGTPVLLPRSVGDLGLPTDATLRYDDLREGLMQVLSLPDDTIAGMAQAAQAWAHGWTWDDVAARTAAVYRTALARSAGPDR